MNFHLQPEQASPSGADCLGGHFSSTGSFGTRHGLQGACMVPLSFGLFWLCVIAVLFFGTVDIGGRGSSFGRAKLACG